MNVGNNPGLQAAQQLMQSSSKVAELAVKQVSTANQNIEHSKDSALQNSAKQLSSSADRKGQVIDIMA